MDAPRRKPTLKNIADAAGVHPSTVSRALSSSEHDSRIPAETVERIRKAARELDYEPNPWAQSLRTRRSMMLGLVIPRLTDYVLAHVFESAQRRALEHGYQTITLSTGAAPASGRAQNLIERHTDGLILADVLLDDSRLDELAAARMPFVLLNRTSGSHPSVSGDDELGGYLATRHLLEQGHRRIAHLSGPSTVSTGLKRAAGYRRALEEAGIAADPALVAEGEFDVPSALAAAQRLLGLADRPTALFAVNDISALAAMSVARDSGLRVPEDLALVGYNDSEVSPLLPIPLTSVRVPLLDMGILAVDALIDRMGGAMPPTRLLEPVLVPRQSSLARR